MKQLHLHKTIMGLSFLMVAISSLLTACSDVEDVGDLRYMNSYCLRFLDGPEFEEGKQEVLRVTSSAQTIELKIKEVTDPEAPAPTDLFVKVDEWNEQTKRYYEISRFRQPSDYYKVYTKKENDETIIYIEFSENNTNNDRILRLVIFSDFVYRGVNNIIINPMGIMQIIQQPNVEEAHLSAVKAKYK